MAQASYAVTQGSVDVNKTWRKIQGKVAIGIQLKYKEYGWFEDWPSEDIDWSQRETLIPLDIFEEIGVAKIPEGGKLARPSSVNLSEISVPLTQFNARFTVSKLSKYADMGMANQVEPQLKYQAAKKIQALGRKFADEVYGVSTGTICLTDSDVAGAATATLVLKDGYGKADVDDAAYLASKFRVNEYYALVDGATLVTNGIFRVDAITAAVPSLNVTFNGLVTVSNNNLKIVGAASLENTTLAGTDYNRGLSGFIDVTTAVTLHGLDSTLVPAWAATADTGGGRLTTERLLKAESTIEDLGGGTMTDVLMTHGVYRDLVKQEKALVRHDSPMGMEVDGSVKRKGVTIRRTKNVPPQHTFCWDKKSYRKVALLPKPEGTGGLSWGDGKELIDDDGMIFEVNLVAGLFTNNRANHYYFSALTEA